MSTTTALRLLTFPVRDGHPSPRPRDTAFIRLARRLEREDPTSTYVAGLTALMKDYLEDGDPVTPATRPPADSLVAKVRRLREQDPAAVRVLEHLADRAIETATRRGGR